jgi:hypothetical protein
LRKNEPTSKSSNLALKASFAKASYTQFLTEIRIGYGPVFVAAFAALFLTGSIPQAYACGYMLSPLRGF